MDLSATQVYEDEEFPFTQKISLEEEEPVQVGTLSIDSTDYQINTGTTKIGRLGSCNIVINDVTVSKLHAEIEASRGQRSTWISDLNSSNKTKLNNLILRPTRLYELKDGSIIEFGRVRATYRTYCPADNTMIPETPAPPRQKVASTIIPNTPDSSFNNSSGVNSDGSVILGTQRDDEDSVFRRPRIPKSTSTSKNNSLTIESNDSQNPTLHTSDININKNQDNIFDAETQKFEEGHKRVSKSIHDTETQEVLTDISEHLVEANAKAGKQLNIHDKLASGSVMDIHDMETQNIDDISEMETQKSEINIQNVSGKKFITDIHIMKTQDRADDKGDSDAQKSEISKNNSQKKHLTQIGQNIHDLETQQFNNKYIAENISDLETQLELDDNARCEQNRDISNMETQIVADGTANETNNDRVNKDKDKDSIANTAKDRNHENITKSPKSRSSSPGSLNLSSPGIDCPSSPLNQSDHLLESSYLLEFFGQGIDKQEKTSTPKPVTKVSSDRNSNNKNMQDAVNNEENNDEDIFEASTQCISNKFEPLISDDSETSEEDALVRRMCKVSKKKRGKPQLEKTNTDSETDAEEYITELAEKQCKSSGTSNKLSKENINNRDDPGTSVESEDIFDVLTQRLDNPTTKDTSDSINQPQKTNDRAVDDMESTQIVNNIDQNNRTNINDMAPTQLILSRETSPKTVINSEDQFVTKSNQNDMDNMATRHIINAKSIDCTTENFDRENIEYELAPTQVISEIEEKRNSNRERDSSHVKLNDTLEEKLNEMFDNVNNDTNNIPELPHMSTQCLEDILESPCDDSTNKSIADDRDTDSVLQKQLRKKNYAPYNQHSHNLLSTEVNANNVNKAETDSQNSDVYFSTTRRKRNILKDTQEFVENVTPCQNVDSSQTSKADNEKATNNIAVEFNNRRKRISKSENKSDKITETLNDDNRNKIISSGTNERSLRSSKLMKLQKDETASEMSKQVLGRDSAKLKVDDAEENTSICTPCPSVDGQRAQTLNTSYESDDDILTRLPAVRISGTFSNPASPSASSTSTVHSTRSKRGIARNKKKKPTFSKEKSRQRENLGRNNKPSVDNHSNRVLDTLTTVKIPGLVDTSEDSETDSETKYKRFQQMADRMLGNERSLRRQDKGSKRNTRISDMSENPKQSKAIKSKTPARTSSRMTRRSGQSRQSDESSCDLQREVRMKDIAHEDRSTEPETKSAVSKRKISTNMIEKNKEQITSKKRKTAQVTEECSVYTRGRKNIMKIATDKQSPNVLEYFKMSSCGNSSIIENTKSSEDNETISKTTLEETKETSLNSETDGNVDLRRSKRTRHIIYDRQDTTGKTQHISDVIANGSNKKNKPARTEGTQMSQSQDKVLRVLLSPIKSLADDESQEVERIMAKGPSSAQDKNVSIRESSKAKILQRELRSRRRKRSNSDTETDSVLTESGMSSDMGDSDSMQLDNSVPKAKYGRFAKNFVSSLPKAQVSIKKETFKKPMRIKNSPSLTLDSSVESTIGESSQDSTESDASISSRELGSKRASIRKKENTELNQNTHRLIDESASKLNTKEEIMSLSTPSRTRRSTSILSNSALSAMRHKVLFTGITEDYSTIVKTLGGNKVEDPAKCTILVTDKVRRTYKFLCALAKGVPIVAINWLRDSEAAARFLDWENYILKDPAAEAKFGFRLRKSLDKAKEKKLLDGYIVVLTPSVAPPPIEELKDMVSSCGGKSLLRPPTKWPERAIVLSREEDLPNAKKFLAKAPKTVTIQSTEFILTGILRQETDFDKYKLM